MKNVSVIISIFCVVLISCSKDHQQKPAKNNSGSAIKHAVKINVSAFSISTGTIGLQKNKNLALKTNSASDTTLTAAGILCYYYVVYDVNGNEIRRIARTAADPTHEINYYGANGATTPQQADLSSTPTNDAYGAVTDSLATGTYTVIIIGVHGAYKSFFIDTHQESYGISYLPLSTAYFNYVYNLDTNASEEDTFLYKGTLTVGQTDVQANFSMSRITAQLTIKATDVVPPAASKISIEFDAEYDGLNLIDLTPNLPSQIEAGYGRSIPIPSTNYGLANTEYSCPIINTTTPINLTIKCVDANNNLIGSPHVINQVKFTPNQRIILTGNLFGTITVNGTSGTITANPQFGADSTVVNF